METEHAEYSRMVLHFLCHLHSQKMEMETLGHASTRRDLLYELKTHIDSLMEVKTVLQRSAPQTALETVTVRQYLLPPTTRFLDDLRAPRPLLQPETLSDSLTDSVGFLAPPVARQ